MGPQFFYRNGYAGVLTLLLMGLSLAAASSHSKWEMRVCAEPYDFPASSRADGGFNNDIALILADELGAHVDFEWTVLTKSNVERTLLSGTCDVIIGVAENTGETLNTVPYLRAPYVFISKEHKGITVTSLDDPVLERLRIGTYQTGIPSLALRNRDIEKNVFEFAPIASPGGPDRHTQVLDALVADEIDVAIVYGPAAASRALREKEEFRIVPVQPEVDVGASLISLFRTWTIGVRPHDEAFRDRLNIALAARWEEIRQAIDSYGVPQLSITRPDAPPGATRESVAVIAPAATGVPLPLESIGAPALAGALLAESTMATDGAGENQLRVVHASAPNEEAAVRAAERVIATENSFAIIGGFGKGEAGRIAELAENHRILFFNVAAVSDFLRDPLCNRTAFHIEASESMYVDVLVDWFTEQGARSIYIVHENTESATTLAQRTSGIIDERAKGIEVKGTAAAERQQFVYTDIINRIAEAEPDVVLLLLRPEDQEIFLSQYPVSASAAPVSGFPHPLSQTREHLFRFRDINPAAGTTPRAALWEASLQEGEAGGINRSYLARNGSPMEPSAWATYSSLLILFQAVNATGSQDPSELISYLERPSTSFELGKGAPLSFRPWDHQLRQPLYLVQVRQDASWGRSAVAKLEVARLVAERPGGDEPSVTAADLDRFGRNANSSSCRF